MSKPGVRSMLFAGVALFLLGVAPALADGPFRFFNVTPCRVLDTRNVPEGPALSANTTRDFQVQGKCGVPVGAKAATLNVTVVSWTGQGHLRLFPSGTATPTISTINYTGASSAALANGAIVPLSTNANDLSVFTFFQSGTGTTHLILDVTGYFAPPPP